MAKKTFKIDINCDLGEGIGNEADIIPWISSCNLACGGHAGSPELLDKIMRMAKNHKVNVGAHPSYPDRNNFGRLSMTLSKKELQRTLSEQLSMFQEAASLVGVTMHHIKAHGALYNDLAANPNLALIYLEVLNDLKISTVLFAPCGSLFAQLAKDAGYMVWEEAFGDRAYNSDGSLLSRSKKGAVLTEPKVVLDQVKQMVSLGQVQTHQNTIYTLNPRTICLHGDTPGALELLTYLRQELPLVQIAIAK